MEFWLGAVPCAMAEGSVLSWVLQLGNVELHPCAPQGHPQHPQGTNPCQALRGGQDPWGGTVTPLVSAGFKVALQESLHWCQSLDYFAGGCSTIFL